MGVWFSCKPLSGVCHIWNGGILLYFLGHFLPESINGQKVEEEQEEEEEEEEEKEEKREEM